MVRAWCCCRTWNRWMNTAGSRCADAAGAVLLLWGQSTAIVLRCRDAGDVCAVQLPVVPSCVIIPRPRLARSATSPPIPRSPPQFVSFPARPSPPAKWVAFLSSLLFSCYRVPPRLTSSACPCATTLGRAGDAAGAPPSVQSGRLLTGLALCATRARGRVRMTIRALARVCLVETDRSRFTATRRARVW